MEKNKKRAFFTIDVERLKDTECVYNSKQPITQTMMDGLERYIKILDKYNIKATMFVLSNTVDEIKDKLKEYIKNGHKIALHGKSHIPPKMMDNEVFKEQIIQAREKLESTFGVSVIGYRAPCFSIDRKKLDILKEVGFKYDSSRLDFGARHSSYVNMDGFEKISSEIYKKDDFIEFGLSTQKIFGKKFPVSGGGYIRIANWTFIQSILSKYIKKNNSYVFYSHPFELSKEKIPRIKNLKLYDRYYLSAGMFSYPYKIEYIIKKLKKLGYEFLTFEDVAQEFIQ